MLTESKASRGGFVPKKKKFPRRRQSLVGHKIKRNARERIEDIACPLPDELFNDDNQCLCSSPSTQSLSPAGHRRLDMLKSSCNDHKQNQKELEQSADHQLDAINSASTQQIHSTISSAIQYSGTSQDTNHIKRGIQVAMVKRMQPCNNINRSGLSLSDPSVFRMNSDVQETDSDTSYVSFSVSLLSNEDGSDCCSHIWDGLVKLTALLIRLGNFAAEHEILAYPLAAIAFYICLGLLQPMIASVIAALTGWVWPPLHFFLASTAGFVWRVADWLYSMDQLGRNMICDMAASYCRHYRLLCDHQCSFVDRAMDGIKTSRNCLG